MNSASSFKKTILHSAVLFALGFSAAHAASGPTSNNNFTMLTSAGTVWGGENGIIAAWPGQTCDTSTTSNNFSNMTLTPSVTFSGYMWTAHHLRVFGPGTYTIDTECTTAQLNAGTCGANVDLAKNYTFTVPAGQVGAHMLFDWNGNLNIDVVNVWAQNAQFGPSLLFTGGGNDANTVWSLMSTDWDGDSQNGSQMIDGPFAGFGANFNLNGISPPANNVACGTDIDLIIGPVSFTTVTDAELSTSYTSNAITVSGLGVTQTVPNPAQTANISITGGQYSVSTDGGTTWSVFSTTVPATVSNGDMVKVIATSSALNNTTTGASLTIGASVVAFSITTKAGAASAQGSNFTMINPSGGITGGTNDVVAVWDGQSTTDINSTDFSHMSLSSTSPFASFVWTAHHVRVFGPGTYTIDTTCTVAQLVIAADCSSNPLEAGQTQRYYTFTVGAGQLGAHMLFDWNVAANIDVVNIWNMDQKFGPSPMHTGEGACNDPNTPWDFMSIDWDSDGRNGGKMIDGPFKGFSANFNIRLPGSPILSCSAYAPTVNVDDPSSASGCSISPMPVNTLERADWWLVAGFLAWLGALRKRFVRQVQS